MKTYIRNILLCLASLTAFAGLAPAPSFAASTWQLPVDLGSAGQESGIPDVTMDVSGDALAVWKRDNGVDNRAIEAASRPAGGSWQAPIDLPAPWQIPWTPKIALDSAGNAVAVWVGYDGSDDVVQASSRPAGGSWQAPIDLGTGWGPQVAFDHDGNAVAVWTGDNGPGAIIQAASRPAGGAWEAPVNLSPLGQAESPLNSSLAIDSGGDAVVVWNRDDGTNTIIQAAGRPAGGVWEAPVDLGAASDSYTTAQVALDSAGNAIAVWRGYDSTNIQAASRPAGGLWEAPVDLGAGFGDPQIAFDDAGNALAVWTGSGSIHASSRSVGEAWQAPVSIGVVANPYRAAPRISLDHSGNSLVIWEGSNGTNTIIQAAGRPAGGVWQSPIDLSSSGQNAYFPTIATGPTGPVAVWERYNGTDYVVQATSCNGARCEQIVPSEPTEGSADSPPPTNPPSPNPSPPANPTTPQQTGSGCPRIKLIGVRGSGEPQGLGKPVGAFSRALAKRLHMRPNDGRYGVTPLAYPATKANDVININPFDNKTKLAQTKYGHSVAAGIRDLRAVLRNDPCRKQARYVLAGYSQGAQVIGDAIEHHKLGRGKARIFATVFFGDPKFDARLRHAAFLGSSRRSKQGIFGGRLKKHGRNRNLFAGYNVLSYCRRLDPFCEGNRRRFLEGIIAKGQYAAHEGYQRIEAQEAAKRVASEWLRR